MFVKIYARQVLQISSKLKKFFSIYSKFNIGIVLEQPSQQRRLKDVDNAT